MKIYTLFLSLLFACGAIAHEDHLLGEGIEHELYHVAFWLLMLVLAYKGLRYLLHRIQKNRLG